MDTQTEDDLNTTVGDNPTGNSLSKFWAVLAPCSSSTGTGAVEVAGSSVVLGRAREVDVVLPDRRVSARHAKIYREPVPSDSNAFRVFVVDLSTNGTFIDRKRIPKNTPIKIQSGVEISLSPPDSNTKIAFLFQQLESTYGPSSSTSPPQDTTENSITSTSTDDAPTIKSDHTLTNTSTPAAHPTNPPDSSAQIAVSPSLTTDKDKQETEKKEEKPKESEVKNDKRHNEDESNMPSAKKQKTGLEDAADTTTQPDTQSDAKPADTNTTPVATKSEDTKAEDTKPGDTKSEDTKSEDTKSDTKLATKPDAKQEKEADNDIEEHLICGICQSLFHKCISLIPCMHNFCAYCIGEWSQRSNQCPQCRKTVKGVSKNHIINNVVGGYLATHPSRARPQTEIEEMDANCPITEQMLQKGKLYGLAGWGNEGHDHSDDDDEEEEDDSDASDDEDNVPTCRACRAPGPDGYQCPTNGPHLVCSSCNQLVPNRPASTDPLHPTPKIQCELCSRVHCDPYWTCSAFYGRGALKPLSQYQFNTIPPHTMLNNAPEIQYTLDILTFNHITGGTNGLWKEILSDLDNGKLQLQIAQAPVTSTKTSCHNCAKTVFESLVYTWRAAVPADKVPPLVAMRPNCHWGKHCRTQQHKVDHATRFNHICEQTKF